VWFYFGLAGENRRPEAGPFLKERELRWGRGSVEDGTCDRFSPLNIWAVLFWPSGRESKAGARFFVLALKYFLSTTIHK